jgi:exopolyphosphatase / guanosine-5'-triphosphate,3'-diphosphate pyrophosphatase
MLLAAIDIGSNAVRLFFSNVFEQDQKIVVEKASLLRIPIRLGDEVFTHNKIPEHKILRLIKTMKAFSILMDVYQPIAYKAVATSAMREAKNGDNIVRKIADKTGIQIEIIDGVEEAKVISAVQNINQLMDYNFSMFIDVGGGSTEISIMSKKGLIGSRSFRIGTVRLLKDNVKKKEWTQLRDWLNDFKKSYDNMLFVASGGNINKIAKLYGRVNENVLPFNNLEYAIRDLEKFNLKQRIELMGLRPDRADVIVPAALIYHFIMKNTRSKFLLVPKIGLCDGLVNILYQEIREKKKKGQTVVVS